MITPQFTQILELLSPGALGRKESYETYLNYIFMPIISN
jgi:hypothetical protein